MNYLCDKVLKYQTQNGEKTCNLALATQENLELWGVNQGEYSSRALIFVIGGYTYFCPLEDDITYPVFYETHGIKPNLWYIYANSYGVDYTFDEYGNLKPLGTFSRKLRYLYPSPQMGDIIFYYYRGKLDESDNFYYFYLKEILFTIKIPATYQVNFYIHDINGVNQLVWTKTQYMSGGGNIISCEHTEYYDFGYATEIEVTNIQTGVGIWLRVPNTEDKRYDGFRGKGSLEFWQA